MRILIASDWHLGSYSSPAAWRLACGFLDCAERNGDLVVLNGDIFEGIFEPVSRAERAHPAVCLRIDAMARKGRLVRTSGNHDPSAGESAVVIDHSCAGRVLVTHGDCADPVHHSILGGVGDGISRRFGAMALVRGAARVAEAAVAGVASLCVDRLFRHRCRRFVESDGCDLGVFGHIHRQYLVPGDRYANAGSLKGDRLEFLSIGPSRAELGAFTIAELATWAVPAVG